MKRRAPQNADIAILTVLEETYRAVCKIFALSNHDDRSGYQWTWGKVRLRSGLSVLVVTGLPLDRENVAAATFAGAMLQSWRPRDLLLVDVGGAVKGRDNIRLGDVVTHTVLHYYDYHKVQESGDESPRYLSLPGASTRLRELSRRSAQRQDDSWISSVFQPRPSSGSPKVLQGEMLVGGAILSDSPKLRRLLDQYPKALAVEMEGVGVARAVLDWSTQGLIPEFLVIRGMSDFCNQTQSRNQKTREKWRRYAACAAAAHAFDLIQDIEPQGRGGGGQRPDSVTLNAVEVPFDNLWEAGRTVLRGRSSELALLRNAFKADGQNRRAGSPHVIWGEAGVGKSALAREVTESLASEYSIRWWIDASDLLKIRAGLRELACRLGIPLANSDPVDVNSDEAHSHRFLSELREVLKSRGVDGRVLVVLDNVDDAQLKHNLPSSVLRYLPPETCDVLITSQASSWRPVAVSGTEVVGLPADVGASLVAEESGRAELVTNEDVHVICSSFGGRPLFLKQVASLLQDGDDPKVFRLRLDQSTEGALETLPEIDGFAPLWSTTYALATSRADAARPGSRKLINTLAFLSPEPIPESLVRAISSSRSDLPEAHIDGILGTLCDRSLLQCQLRRGNGRRSYVLHRVVGAILRRLTRITLDFPQAFSVAARAVWSVAPNRAVIRRQGGDQSMTEIAPHIEVIAKYALAQRASGLTLETLEAAAEASSLLGLHRRTLSEWAAADEASKRAVDLSSPTQLPAREALRRVRWANIIRQRARFDEAEKVVEQALPSLQDADDPREYAWALTVKARILRHRPDSAPKRVLPILEEAMALLKPYAMSSDSDTIRQLSELHGYLSVVNRQLSNLNVAEAESLEGLRITTGGRSPDDVIDAESESFEPLVATHLRALGGVWRLKGELFLAMRAHQRALAIFESTYGQFNTDVSRALDSLGRVQREWGELECALTTFERAESVSNKLFGPINSHSATAIINCALVHLEVHDYRRALQSAEKGLSIYSQVYGERLTGGGVAIRNESTAWALFVQANAFVEGGRMNEALAQHELVLNWRQSRYPRVHALIASSHYALGDVLCLFGDASLRERALEHHRLSLVIREQVFGLEPNYWLAQSQARVGTLTGSAALLIQARNTYRRQLKPDHWRTNEVDSALTRLV